MPSTAHIYDAGNHTLISRSTPHTPPSNPSTQRPAFSYEVSERTRQMEMTDDRLKIILIGFATDYFCILLLSLPHVRDADPLISTLLLTGGKTLSSIPLDFSPSNLPQRLPPSSASPPNLLSCRSIPGTSMASRKGNRLTVLQVSQPQTLQSHQSRNSPLVLTSASSSEEGPQHVEPGSQLVSAMKKVYLFPIPLHHKRRVAWVLSV